MSTYHVKLIETAAGAVVHQQDLGKVDAESKDGAIRKMLKKHFHNKKQDWEYLSGCMTTKVVG